MKNHHIINVSPFATNVLDLIGRDDLFTSYGSKVIVRRSGNDFAIDIEGKDTFITDGNIEASYYLNQNEIGVIQN